MRMVVVSIVEESSGIGISIVGQIKGFDSGLPVNNFNRMQLQGVTGVVVLQSS